MAPKNENLAHEIDSMLVLVYSGADCSDLNYSMVSNHKGRETEIFFQYEAGGSYCSSSIFSHKAS